MDIIHWSDLPLDIQTKIRGILDTGDHLTRVMLWLSCTTELLLYTPPWMGEDTLDRHVHFWFRAALHGRYYDVCHFLVDTFDNDELKQDYVGTAILFGAHLELATWLHERGYRVGSSTITLFRIFGRDRVKDWLDAHGYETFAQRVALPAPIEEKK